MPDKDYERLYNAALDVIREIEEKLEEQSIELNLMGRASIETREEDTGQLAEYKATNSDLIEFVEKVADSQSKFGTEARKLLGRD